MAHYEKDFPNLSKLGIALLEHWASPILGSEAIQVIKSPVLEKELVISIGDALCHAEERFLIEFPDDELSQIILNLPFRDLPSFQAAVRSFVDRPTNPQLQEYLIENILKEIQISDERARIASGCYIELVREELSMISSSFRSKVVSKSILQTEENVAAVVDRLEKILHILSNKPETEFLDSRKVPESKLLKQILKTLYEDKRKRKQQVTRADLFCSLVRCRLKVIDLDPIEEPRIFTMLNDFEQRLNATNSIEKFYVTDTVKELLLKGRIRAREAGKDRLDTLFLLEVLLEDPGENITNGLTKHGYTPAEILYELRLRSVGDLFSNGN